MVVCMLHLISLKKETTISSFLSKLRESRVNPVIRAKALRWMITPSTLSSGYLLARNLQWNLLLGLEADAAIPSSAATEIDAIWTVACGVSSAAVSGYQKLNSQLLQAAGPRIELPSIQPKDSSQSLEVSSEMREWIAALPAQLQHRPVSMLNLLAFNPGKAEQYRKYGAEFSSRVGLRYGGHVKVVGRVVDDPGQARQQGWDEIAFVHYPSLNHFASMLADDDYQAVNQEYRLAALKDTFILCVLEINDNGEPIGQQLRGKL